MEELNYSGSLRLKNPETIKKWKDSGAWQDLLNQGYLYANGCGRFRLEECNCCKCLIKKP
jgi:hypothetical protein